MIDFVIPVRNRDDKRIQRCVDSLKSDITGEIYVIDYCSDVPVKLERCTIIRVETDNIWNKAHALNIGIKKCKNEYIGTVDCDMVIYKEFFEKCKNSLNENTFLFTRMVKRILPDILDWNLNREQLIKISRNWMEGSTLNLHEAVGGIQIFSKKWIHRIRGIDENLTYWGGIDNDTYERAIRTGLVMIDINSIILHQEHENQKENNLKDKKEIEFAKGERMKRRAYLVHKWNNKMNIGPEKWGIAGFPQQQEINITIKK